MLLILVSSIPCFVVKHVIIGAYEDRSVAWRTAEIQEQCTILSHHLATSDYLNNPVSEEVDAELSMLSNIYNGRALVIDEEYKVVKDTFGSDEGKTIIAPDVITCFEGSGTSYYDDEARYLDITTQILETKGEEEHGKRARVG